MKYLKIAIPLILILTISGILFFLSIKKNPPSYLVSEPIHIYTEIPVPNLLTPEKRILSSMSVEEKVGQLFMFGFDGTTLTKENKEFLKNRYIGGVLLLGKNISSEEQLKALISDIQSINEIPLFISIDQEGGIVSRIKWNTTLTKAQMDISNEDMAYDIAKSRGEILKGYGINMNLAPVVEYITDSSSFMYDRVYRGSIQQVSEKSIGSIEGYRDAGIVPVAKHYPGHSNQSPDSHYDLPIINIGESDWDSYVYPFTSVLERTTVDAIMVGHIKYPNIDSKPTTISKEIITERLINDLSYEGIIISDDMEMDALDDIDTYTNIAKQALQAGNDILIYSKYSDKYPTIQKDLYEYIVQEVKNGNMDIDEKVLKILKVKRAYNIL